MTSYLPWQDRNQSVLSELDVYLAKGTLQMENTTPDGD